jgi:hypothetical protein
MRDQERRRQVWKIIDQKRGEIDELRKQVRSEGLRNLLDRAFGHLEFARQVLGNSTEVFKYLGAEEDEQRLFEAVDLFIRIASNQIERARKILQEFGPDATPL